MDGYVNVDDAGKQLPSKKIPTIEGESDTIAECIKKRRLYIVLLLILSIGWSIAGPLYSGLPVFFFSIPSILILLGTLCLSNSYERSIQKNIRFLSFVNILKSVIGLGLASYLTWSYIKINGNEWKSAYGISWIVTSTLEGLFLILGVYVSMKTKKIVQVLDLDFFHKEWSNYFQISHEA